jgi:hypothetical protein
MRRGLLACLLGLAVCAGLTPVAAAEDTPAADAVIGFIDTGINPYHEAFRDDSPRARQHPSTYLPGFPADAPALHLTLDAPDWRSAVRADCDLWKTVELGALYWIPGTRIVGAISVDDHEAMRMTSACRGMVRILDEHGHGTMVASRAAGEPWGACPECLIVAVQGFTLEAVEWVAANRGWIDAQSNSWGQWLPIWDPVDALAGTSMDWYAYSSDFSRRVEAAAQQQPALWASGNGALGRFGAVGHPTVLHPGLTPSVISVGGHDSGYVNTWPGFTPHVVSDSCQAWAVAPDATEGWDDTIASGTSIATPYVAGGAGAVLREARALLGDARTGVRDGVVAEGPPGQPEDGPPCGATWAP